MALDEALLLSDAPPTLRFYTWRPGALSLGYFQRFDDVPASRSDIVVVRRLTGGGAIHHERELTFALVAAEREPPFTGSVRDSYARVHGAIASALAGFGVCARARGQLGLDSDRPATGMCFHASTDLDLAWDGRKGVGSAQRRTHGRVLHHGSIKLGTTRLESGIATLGAAEPPALAARVAAALESELGLRLAPAQLSPAELRRATQRAPHFRSPAWIQRR
jgi:lipoate-protein ligase A